MPQARLSVTTHLGEAVFDDTTKTVRVKILEPGWSKNGNYYSPVIAEAIAAKIRESTKTYCDHKQDEQTKKFGRSLRDWAATVHEAAVENGVPYAVLRMTENPETGWLYEEAKKHPQEVGVSIDAQAKVTEHGEAEGKKGRIVEEILSARCDFVASPSAGGRVMQVWQSLGDVVEMVPDGAKKPLPMAMMDIQGMAANREKARKEKDKEWDLMDAFKTVMHNIHDAENVATDEEKAAAFAHALEDLKVGLAAIDWSAIASEYSKVMASCGMDVEVFLYQVAEVDLPDAPTWVERTSVTEAAYTFTDASWGDVDKPALTADDYLIVGDPTVKGTWHLPYKSGTTIYKGALRAISTILTSGQFRGKPISFTIPPTVREKVTRLLKAAKIGVYAESLTDHKEDSPMTDEEIRQAITEAITATMTPVTQQVANLTTLIETHAQVVDRLDVAANASAQRDRIEVMIREAGLPAAYVTEPFRRQLLTLTEEAAIKEAIEDRKSVVFRSVSRVVDSGVTFPATEAITDVTKLPKTAEERLAAFVN